MTNEQREPMNSFAPSVARMAGRDVPGQTADVVHVLFCTNSLFLQHAAVCIASLLANNRDVFFDIVIVSQHDERLDEARLRSSVGQFPHCSLTFRQFRIPESLTLPLVPFAHYTLDAYVRLWIGEFFPPDVRRVLYLDADIVTVDSIASLWKTDLDGALMAAVDIPGSEQGVANLKMRMEDGYFNSGVLLIDLQEWRNRNATETVIAYIQKYPERILYDQDALNACFYACTKRIPYKWNVIWPFYREPIPLPLDRAEIERVRQEAVIIHFNGASKPWSYFCDHPRKAEYEKYLAMTAWRDYVPYDRTPMNRLRKLASRLLPRRVKTGIKAVIAAAASDRRRR